MNFKNTIKYLCLVSIVMLAQVSPAISDDLQTAYQKEYAYLEDQQRNLVTRLAKFKAQSKVEIRQETKKLDSLALQFRGLKNESKNLNDIVFESERTLESAKDNKDIFTSTFDQAEDTLKSYKVTLNAHENMAGNKKINLLFSHVFKVMHNISSVRKESGSFFTENGDRVNGELLHLGQIATYGKSPTSTGILVPAGEGEYKLWQQPAVELTNDLFANKKPSQLSVFIYENSRIEVNASAAKNVTEYITSGGMVGWIIVMLGGLAMVLIALRAVFLKSASSASEKILSGIKSYVVEHDISGAQAWCKKFKGSTSRVVSATLRNLDRDRDHLEDIVAESILHESPVLNRFGAVIMVIAAVTPLLGLLGTVTGMISTFDIITEFGTGDPKLLSGGISVALVTTQLGLIVAIPALILGNLLSGWSNRIKDDMEKAALNVINIYDAPQLAK